MKLSERSIRIKELIGSQVDMGTFGLVELELQAFDKEIAELKNCNLQNVSVSLVHWIKTHPDKKLLINSSDYIVKLFNER